MNWTPIHEVSYQVWFVGRTESGYVSKYVKWEDYWGDDFPFSEFRIEEGTDGPRWQRVLNEKDVPVEFVYYPKDKELGDSVSTQISKDDISV